MADIAQWIAQADQDQVAAAKEYFRELGMGDPTDALLRDRIQTVEMLGLQREREQQLREQLEA
ncbi:hypothetical protein JCM8097_004279, partial [Rhodosporidiobolus ruineniae]